MGPDSLWKVLSTADPQRCFSPFKAWSGLHYCRITWVLLNGRLEMWQFLPFYWFRGRGRPLPQDDTGGQGVCLSCPQITQQWCWLTSWVCGEDKLVTLCSYQGHCNPPHQLITVKAFFRNCSSLLHQKSFMTKLCMKYWKDRFDQNLSGKI